MCVVNTDRSSAVLQRNRTPVNPDRFFL